MDRVLMNLGMVVINALFACGWLWLNPAAGLHGPPYFQFLPLILAGCHAMLACGSCCCLVYRLRQVRVDQ